MWLAGRSKAENQLHENARKDNLKRARKFAAMLIASASLMCSPAIAQESQNGFSTEACKMYIDAKRGLGADKSNYGNFVAARRELIKTGGLSAPLKCVQGNGGVADIKSKPKIIYPRNKDNTLKDIIMFIGTLVVIHIILDAIRGGEGRSLVKEVIRKGTEFICTTVKKVFWGLVSLVSDGIKKAGKEK